MSFESLLNEADLEEFSRLAQEILVELDLLEMKIGGDEGRFYSGDGVRRAGRFLREAAYLGAGERFYGDLVSEELALLDINDANNYLDRIENREKAELFSRDVSRRKRGQALGGSDEIAGGESFDEVLTATQELSQSSLPERLSERFCREARRYDGAFERY